MKAKLFFSLLAAMLLQFTTVKADTYSDGIKKLIEAGVLNYGSSVDIDAEMLSSIAEWFLPYYRDNMTEEQFTQMVTFTTQPEYMEIQKKVISSMSSDPSKLQNMISMDAIQTIMGGGTPSDLKLPECDAQFLKEIQHYMAITKTEEIAGSAISTIKDVLPKQMAGQMPEEQLQQMQTLFNGLFGYIEKNIGVIVTTQILQSLSIDDMKKLNSIENQPFFPAYKKTNEAVAKNMKSLMETVMQNVMSKMMK